MSPNQCPRCDCVEFNAHDRGPDSFEDDIFYISYSCIRCELWWDGWFDEWLEYEGGEIWADGQYCLTKE